MHTLEAAPAQVDAGHLQPIELVPVRVAGAVGQQDPFGIAGHEIHGRVAIVPARIVLPHPRVPPSAAVVGERRGKRCPASVAAVPGLVVVGSIPGAGRPATECACSTPPSRANRCRSARASSSFRRRRERWHRYRLPSGVRLNIKEHAGLRSVQCSSDLIRGRPAYPGISIGDVDSLSARVSAMSNLDANMVGEA